MILQLLSVQVCPRYKLVKLIESLSQHSIWSCGYAVNIDTLVNNLGSGIRLILSCYSNKRTDSLTLNKL